MTWKSSAKYMVRMQSDRVGCGDRLEGRRGVQETDTDAADEIITRSVFIKHLNLQPVVAFNDIKVVLFVPNGRLAAAVVSFAAPGATDIKSCKARMRGGERRQRENKMRR